MLLIYQLNKMMFFCIEKMMGLLNRIGESLKIAEDDREGDKAGNLLRYTASES
jgi:hypothetical protein